MTHPSPIPPHKEKMNKLIYNEIYKLILTESSSVFLQKSPTKIPTDYLPKYEKQCHMSS